MVPGGNYIPVAQTLPVDAFDLVQGPPGPVVVPIDPGVVAGALAGPL